MRMRLGLVVGAAVGYVLGAKAGQERYEELKKAAGRVAENPLVRSASSVVQEQAEKAQTLVSSKFRNASAEAPTWSTDDVEAGVSLDEAKGIGDPSEDEG